MRHSALLSLALILCFSAFALAKGIKKERPAPPPDKLTIKRGYQISVDQFDETSQTFLLTIVKEPGVGPNYVTPESLAGAIDFQGDAKAFTKQRAQMIGSVYQLNKDLPLLTTAELAARKKRH